MNEYARYNERHLSNEGRQPRITQKYGNTTYEVHERDSKGKIESSQKVEIHLNFIGEYIPPATEQPKPTLTPKEQAEQEKIQERRERFRRNYEKRVESGKQKEYYERTKYKKRAQYDAEKAALFEESYVLGANVLAP